MQHTSNATQSNASGRWGCLVLNLKIFRSSWPKLDQGKNLTPCMHCQEKNPSTCITTCRPAWKHTKLAIMLHIIKIITCIKQSLDVLFSTALIDVCYHVKVDTEHTLLSWHLASWDGWVGSQINETHVVCCELGWIPTTHIHFIYPLLTCAAREHTITHSRWELIFCLILNSRKATHVQPSASHLAALSSSLSADTVVTDKGKEVSHQDNGSQSIRFWFMIP